MTDQSVWLQALRKSLAQLTERKPVNRGNWLPFRRRNDFDVVCEDIEKTMRQCGANPDDREWQAAKSLMKAVYDRTREAAECGYNFYQFTLSGSSLREAVARMIESEEVQNGLRLWSKQLGWDSADLVDWTAASIGWPSGDSRPLPYRKEQYTVRLQGLWSARQRDRQAEHFGFPVLRTVRERTY